MKNKKGFTLVELLAVIVILAIVALVIVPVVMNVIKDARKKSAIESFRGYMDAVEKTIIRDSMKATSELPEKDSNGCYSLRELDSKVKVKGDHPEIEETDKLCVENGKIKSISEVEMNGYALEYKDGDILLNGQAIEDKTIPEITIGSITATTNSITIPYEVQSGKSGVTVTCEYGTSESYGHNGTIQDNKCILSGLNDDTKYYFRLNSKTGKNKTANQASSATTKTLCDYTVNQQFNFGYTGNVQEFNPKCKGKYKLEVWGAQGGSGNNSSLHYGGYGAYSYGTYAMLSNSSLYVVVGGKGTDNSSASGTSSGGYNGGGTGYRGGGGGGATHIATRTGLLSSLSSYQADVLIVAGAGGGGGSSRNSNSGAGGSGGGYEGSNGWKEGNQNTTVFTESQSSGTRYGQGGHYNAGGYYDNVWGNTSVSSGSFGQGGRYGVTTGCGATGGSEGGGGAGWYGGAGTCDCDTDLDGGGGGGGSGHLNTSKLTNYGMYCYTGCSGANTTVTTSTGAHVVNAANTGNGYARITYLGK